MSVAVTQQHYQFISEGEKPLPLLKQHMEELKVASPEHPLLNAKGYELVAIPEGQHFQHFVGNFLSNTAEPNKVYIAILKLGATKTEVIENTVMTGKCNVKEEIAKGARKWETKHIVYHPVQVKDMDGVGCYDENSQPIMRNLEVGSFDTKGDAMTFAKQYAIDHDTEVIVEIEKRLNGSLHRVADITPMKKKVKETRQMSVNQFLYFGRGA